jgi:DNA-binding CsgD family transcriptional regulator/tetratricopeptide (TPR) repeat protein
MTRREDHNLPLVESLTPREEEILRCLGDELSNRQIAEQLTISLNTVKWYARQIYNKLGVDNRGDAVSQARRLGLLPDAQDGVFRHNLPVPATPFVGREQELSKLADFIADPNVRLVTILGPGGIGKTRLALEAARRELDQELLFPGGVFFISLAPINMAKEIVTTMATTLNFHFHDEQNEMEQLLNYLRRRQVLLVMDNFEHVLDGRSILAEICGMAPGVNLIVTSREPLQLHGEQRFPLQGLMVPQSRDGIKETISDYAVAQLFLNIARRTDPDFVLREGDEGQLLRICRLVEGMPLGLELAASWVSHLPLSEIASEIEQSLDLLSTENYSGPQQYQSMQATLDASWIRLSREQQLGFQRLTVFRGGFTRPAAQEVAGSALPLLVALTNKSWLFYDRQNDRYHIHELLRQFGSGKLGGNGIEGQKLKDRHCVYFCDYLRKREMDWSGPRQQRVASEVSAEIDNIHQAWRHAATEGDKMLLDQGLNCLCRFYRWEGRNTDGQSACRSAADGLTRVLAQQPADDPERSALWSRVLVWESTFVSEVAQKVELLTKSQEILDRVALTGRDTKSEQAFLFLAKAFAAGNRAFGEAIQTAAQARAIFRELGDLWGEAEALNFMGNRYIFQGDFGQARDSLRDSLEIRRRIEDTHGIGDTTMNLGLVYQHQGQYDDAEALHLQSIGIFRRLQNQFLESWVLTVLSFTYSWAGKFSAAKRSAEQSVEIRRKLGRVPYLWNLIAIATAVIHLGRYDETKARATQILELARQRGHSAEEAYAQMYLGNIALVDRDSAKAMVHLEKSTRLMTELRYVYQALPRASLCLVLRARGDGQSARHHLARALRSGIRLRSMTPIMYSLPVAALLAADDGRLERAIELRQMTQRFGHLRNSRWFGQVAGQELDELRATLPPDVVAAAESRGRKLDLWETADDVLQELDGVTGQG